MSKISLSQAFEQWRELAATIPQDDAPMLSESWNDYTDALCKDGQLGALQYHYAPAYDESIPGEGSRYDSLEDDREFILNAMDVKMRADEQPGPREGWGEGSRHYRVTLSRNGERTTITYSMGLAHTGGPEVVDVIGSLLLDADAGANSFEDFCSEFGYNTDSRKAEKTWKDCAKAAEKLARLFTPDELEGLRELFEDR